MLDRREFWPSYHRSAHIPAGVLGELLAEARPTGLVLYHGLFYGVPAHVIVDEVRANDDGPVILADEPDVF